MEIAYNGNNIITQTKPYQELPLTQTVTQPTVTINSIRSKYSSLIMYDPDSVKGIFIHWLIINIPKNSNNISSGTSIKNYYKPSPPPKTGKHRYIFELYRHDLPIQVSDKEVSYQYISGILSKNATLVKKLVFLSENKSQIGGSQYTRSRRSQRSRISRRSRRSQRRKIYRKKTRRVYKYKK
jgi:phosphatidylethanolamine-binding protein (PEBP) family uncharacterized protein